MYNHNIVRFNYTTYDIRRAQDIINSWTSHCNVMVLRTEDEVEHRGHRFIYGKVLGIYHVNVIYIGTGFMDYTPIRMEFLWVRWYEPMEQVSSWETATLDRVSFPLLTDEHSFDFLDPVDVLRGSHIIPGFNSCKRHPDGLGMSALARDKHDWRKYYINRYVRSHDFLHVLEHYFKGFWTMICSCVIITALGLGTCILTIVPRFLNHETTPS